MKKKIFNFRRILSLFLSIWVCLSAPVSAYAEAPLLSQDTATSVSAEGNSYEKHLGKTTSLQRRTSVMKGALVGFGAIGMGHAGAYLKIKNLEIIAVVDPTPERKEKSKEIFPNARVYDSFDEMIKCESIDFIDICSPPSTHFEYITKGLSKNCHVICEKPLLLKIDEYKQVYDLMKSSHKIVYPSHNYKFAPALKKLNEIVKEKQFGNIIAGNFRILRAGHAIGVSEWNPDWRRNCDISGGGIVRDHGTHSIYMACNMANKIPVAVSCITGNLKNDKHSCTEDTALLTLYFDNDIRFTMNLLWTSDIRNSYYCVIGEKETAIVENDMILHTNVEKELFKEIIPSEFNDPSHKSWFYSMFLDFLNVVDSSEQEQLKLILEAFVTTLVVEKAYLSAKQNGKPINISSEIDCFARSINLEINDKLFNGEKI